MITVGQRLFRVRTWRRAPECDHVIVTKIGRRWASIAREGGPHFDAGRFDLETMHLDGGGFSSPGRVYLSEAEYRDQMRLEALWGEFQRHLRNQYSIPKGVDAVRLLKAADALGIRLESE